MRPTSNETRKNIIEAKERGEKIRNIMIWFKVSESAVKSIYRKYKEKGSYEPIPYKGRISTFTEETDNKIKAKIKEKPDITLQGLIEELKLNISVSGLWRHLKKLKMSFKKNA